MSFAGYLRFEGRCAIALGAVLVVLAAAFGRWDGPAWLGPAVALVTSVAAIAGARAATRSALAGARHAPPRMPGDAVRRQTAVETVAWAAAVGAWLAATGDSAELVSGTGLATVAFGAVRVRANVPAEALVDRRRYVLGAEVTTPS